MRLRSRRVTIEINQFTLRVQREVPESSEDQPPTSAVPDLAHSPPESHSPAEDAFRTPLLPPDEIA